MTKTYKSKIGFELITFLVIIFGICSYEMILEKKWLGVTFSLGIFFCIILMGKLLRYELNDQDLSIHFWFINQGKISIQSIRKIEETNNMLSAPAFSLDRLEIFYNKYDSILVSPKNKMEFIVHLTNLNPQIEVKMKKATHS